MIDLDNLDPRAVLAIPAVAGLVAHGIFKRREPTLPQFFALTAAIPTLSATVLHQPILLSFQFLGIFLASLTTSILYYRLLSPSHPLASIPGPLLARATQLYIFSRVYFGQTRRDVQAMHVKYGPVVRIGPNEVSIHDIDAITVIHGGKSWIKGVSYDASMTSNPVPEDTSMIALRTLEAHAVRRKVWDRAFAMQSLADYQAVIHTRVGQLCSQLDSRAGEPIDLHTWLGYLVWDVMTDLAYGGGGDKITTASDTGSSIAALLRSIRIAGIGKALPWLSPYLKKIPSSLPDFRTNAAKLFKHRLENGRAGEGKDVFYHLLGEGGKKTDINTTALAADSALVISAGADTTRLVLAYLFLCMVREPARYKALQKYLDETLGDDEFPRNEALMHMPFLESYINETLRLNSPVPFANQRESPEGGAVIAGHFIPEGIQARMATYAMHRDPKWFAYPDEFRPERWMPDSGFQGAHEKKAFFPFLMGPFHCVGRNFALQEMRMTIATLVRRYDMSLAPGFDAAHFEREIADRGQIEIKLPLSVVMTRRKKGGE
ncbi:hypothetical protein RQP46_004054 [Phenoliferia psychrophenolica]